MGVKGKKKARRVVIESSSSEGSDVDRGSSEKVVGKKRKAAVVEVMSQVSTVSRRSTRGNTKK